MIGTGYVGLVSGTCFADIGNKVYCLDKDKKKIEKLNSGISPIYEPGLDEIIKKNKDDGRLIFTSNIHDAVNKSDIIYCATIWDGYKEITDDDLQENMNGYLKAYNIIQR